jgi:hypothetical protein
MAKFDWIGFNDGSMSGYDCGTYHIRTADTIPPIESYWDWKEHSSGIRASRCYHSIKTLRDIKKYRDVLVWRLYDNYTSCFIPERGDDLWKRRIFLSDQQGCVYWKLDKDGSVWALPSSMKGGRKVSETAEEFFTRFDCENRIVLSKSRCRKLRKDTDEDAIAYYRWIRIHGFTKGHRNYKYVPSYKTDNVCTAFFSGEDIAAAVEQ